MGKSIVFIDTEISMSGDQINDMGAIREGKIPFHKKDFKEFLNYVKDSDYVCGHNIIAHDLRYIKKIRDVDLSSKAIDTLFLSPLLFPKHPYHALLKDDKLQVDELNNPLNDCYKAEILFYDEVNAFQNLPTFLKTIYCSLLYDYAQFQGFFNYLGIKPYGDKAVRDSSIEYFIKDSFKDKICYHADIISLIKNNPIELAYSLALIYVLDGVSITPSWLVKQFPVVEQILNKLCFTPCNDGCVYCNARLDVKKALKHFFGYGEFRTFDGEPLQENAAKAAVAGKSLLAIFPTGGGKSITFQIPALMAGENLKGLTVVISPLQSLMKDQVDNLDKAGISGAVTINGLLSPVERKDAIESVRNGSASLLYIAPEQLRSRTIEKIILGRNVVRFVIDEAHCFSAWGQDFRVDYLYIGKFLKYYQEQKHLQKPIPVSCFTATAKEKVVSDICDYFRNHLNVELESFSTEATRKNLHYKVLFQETDADKYNTLRNLVTGKNCPTIIYVSRTRKTVEIAQKLTSDGFEALPFNGKMDPVEKAENQNAFINGDVRIIVATSAFGMGVDKKDVGLVIHYDISDSLENYVQEAGRAGRDPSIEADCYVLYNNDDLDKHFLLLNQTKVSIGEIQQVWKAIKNKTKDRICCSAQEIAREAGWDDSQNDSETRVKTAIAALEDAGYIKRGRNVPQVFATSIQVKNMAEASSKIDASVLFTDAEKERAKQIIKSLITERAISRGSDEGESRVDYLADILGLSISDVISSVNLMKQENILSDDMDMSAYIQYSDTEKKSIAILDRFGKLEQFLIDQIKNGIYHFDFKRLNEFALNSGIKKSTVKDLKTLVYYLSARDLIVKEENKETSVVKTVLSTDYQSAQINCSKRIELSKYILEYLFKQAENEDNTDVIQVGFSVLGLQRAAYKHFNNDINLFNGAYDVSQKDVENALLYLSKIGAIRLEGGFLVIYNRMELERIVKDNNIRYKKDDYKKLDEFYKQKIQQIHIIGKFANMMVNDYNAALQLVHDYFHIDYKKFIKKYYAGDEKKIARNITNAKFKKLFGELSETQAKIINDNTSKYIVVAAGPGSGKTKVLVHKLASLLLMEDIKHEQLLMLTFSRAAATEFKKRLIDLIGNGAEFVDIKTFHSYSFDLLGQFGNLQDAETVVRDATAMIENGDVEPGKILKHVLVIDEAQDMNEDEYNLVKALINKNEDMRVIAVGDDDQCIYEFHGASPEYLKKIKGDFNTTSYELLDNYRSKENIVAFSNVFAKRINNRIKTHNNIAVQKDNGIVKVIKHSKIGFLQAIVDQIKNSVNRNQSITVLTRTNEEASIVLSLLIKGGIKAKLIQSNDGFDLNKLREIFFFTKFIDKQGDFPVIPDDIWNKAKIATEEYAGNSSSMEIVRNFWKEFEHAYPYKYRSDLKEFLAESRYEDFYDNDRNTVIVSTIHKSKGHEFDVVYMLLQDYDIQTEEQKRLLYVGMTRAKQELFIHINLDIFAGIQLSTVSCISDQQDYPTPDRLTLQLSMRDVVLGNFITKNEVSRTLFSGDKVYFKNGNILAVIGNETKALAKLSSKGIGELNKYTSKGFKVYDARVSFVVWWTDLQQGKSCWVILPNLYLKK